MRSDQGRPDGVTRVYSEQLWGLYATLDRSLDPRGPDTMHAMAASYITPGALILDAGCRDASHLIRLVQATGSRGVGVDPVDVHIELARAAVARAGLGQRIEIVQGVMQQLAYPDNHFDLVWCRDVVEVVAELQPALNEAARVLRPTGRMLVYTDFVTDRLEPDERAMLNRHLANVPANLIESNIERAFAGAGLVVEHKDVIGTEWREYAEERTHPASQALLRLARLRRQRARVVAEYGEDIYEHVEANLHWLVYQFLGKLQPTLYLLRRA